MLNPEKSKLVEKEKLSEDQHKVRDILINRIEASYYNRIVKVTDPYEMFMKLKEYKQMEVRTNSVIAKKDIYNIQNIEKLHDKEERDIFLQAVAETFSTVNAADCWTGQGGKELSYLGLKNFILQVESTTMKKKPPRSALFTPGRGSYRARASRGRDFKNRGNRGNGSYSRNKTVCYSCGRISSECSQEIKIFCYNCKQKSDHISRNCPKRNGNWDNSTTEPLTKRAKLQEESIENRSAQPGRGYQNSARGEEEEALEGVQAEVEVEEVEAFLLIMVALPWLLQLEYMKVQFVIPM